MAYTFVDVDTLEGEGPGGMVRKTRRATGTRAFGFNYFTLPPGAQGREHHHVDSNMEEVYFVVRGAGTMQINGDEIELKPGASSASTPARAGFQSPATRASSS